MIAGIVLAGIAGVLVGRLWLGMLERGLAAGLDGRTEVFVGLAVARLGLAAGCLGSAAVVGAGPAIAMLAGFSAARLSLVRGGAR